MQPNTLRSSTDRIFTVSWIFIQSKTARVQYSSWPRPWRFLKLAELGVSTKKRICQNPLVCIHYRTRLKAIPKVHGNLRTLLFWPIGSILRGSFQRRFASRKSELTPACWLASLHLAKAHTHKPFDPLESTYQCGVSIVDTQRLEMRPSWSLTAIRRTNPNRKPGAWSCRFLVCVYFLCYTDWTLTHLRRRDRCPNSSYQDLDGPGLPSEFQSYAASDSFWFFGAYLFETDEARTWALFDLPHPTRLILSLLWASHSSLWTRQGDFPQPTVCSSQKCSGFSWTYWKFSC